MRVTLLADVGVRVYYTLAKQHTADVPVGMITGLGTGRRVLDSAG